MFVYLSKKVAIPNNTNLNMISWNQDQGWITCAGENGMLKVIKLEAPVSSAPGQPPQSNLSMNQTLEGHRSSVRRVLWNDVHRKLTSSDEDGLIIVWMMHKNMWLEEMINNRNQSIVSDMSWNSDGTKIVIVYEDGAVIVGSVEGGRLWGQDLPCELMHVEWSPDSRVLLFGTKTGEVEIYDHTGKQLNTMRISCLSGLGLQQSIATLTWFKCSSYKGLQIDEFTNPSLCVAYNNGRVQLMRNEIDDKPILIDTGMEVNSAAWNHNGTMIAFAGSQSDQAIVQFYTAQGIHMRTLTIAGHTSVTSITWEGNGLRIAIAVDSFIYFANIKPDYKWTYFNQTIAYSYLKPDKQDFSVVFWDTRTDEKYMKYVKKLLGIVGYGEYCALATQAEDVPGQYVIILCNAIGSPVDSKYINIEPIYLAMNKTHLIACSEDSVYVWQYRSQVSRLLSNDPGQKKIGREVAFFVDDQPNLNKMYDVNTYSVAGRTLNDQISCVTAGDTYFLVGRVSGTVQKYALPTVNKETSNYRLNCRPQMITANCNASKFAVIDINGTLSFFDCEARERNGPPGMTLDFEKTDVWDVKWSTDNPDLCAIMEKTRMHIMQNMELEEPIISSGCLCTFNDLEIKAVLMDDIMQSPENPPKLNEMMINFETTSLSETRNMLKTVALSDVFERIEQNPHPRLWRLIADAALENLDLEIAHKAFIKYDDYTGICLIKKLNQLEDRQKQQAEVLIYFKKFDEAEKIYKNIDRKDLALELRMKIGDWYNVLKLIQQGVGNDQLINMAYNEMGDHYADRFKWSKAAKNYALAYNNEKLIEAYYNLEDYDKLEAMIDILPDESPLLQDIAEKFQSVCLCDSAVRAYIKFGDVKKAIDCCVMLNQWNSAVELAERYNFVQIEGILSRYANLLLESNKRMEAIELYRKANRNTESARLLTNIAKEMGKTQIDLQLLKKIYVMAALEVDSYKRRVLDAQMTGTGATLATLDSLITSDINTMDNKALDNPWRGAEAYHYYLLCQKFMYKREYKSALMAALRLTDYENIIPVKDIYSLIALSAFYARYYKECSRAFVKLENLPGSNDEQREAYETLAMNIFSRHPPVNQGEIMHSCPRCNAKVSEIAPNCKSCGTNFAGCIVSGRPIQEKNYKQCKACKHRMIESEARSAGFQNCPLCHERIRFAT